MHFFKNRKSRVGVKGWCSPIHSMTMWRFPKKIYWNYKLSSNF